MKKNKTGLFIVLGLVGVILFSALVSNLTDQGFSDIYLEYQELFNSDELEFVYVGRDGCDYCQAISPLLEQLEEEEEIEFFYLNTDKMRRLDFEDIPNTADVFKEDWGTPTLLSIYDGEIVETVSGYREIEELREFVKKSKEAVSKADDSEAKEESSAGEQ